MTPSIVHNGNPKPGSEKTGMCQVVRDARDVRARTGRQRKIGNNGRSSGGGFSSHEIRVRGAWRKKDAEALPVGA